MPDVDVDESSIAVEEGRKNMAGGFKKVRSWFAGNRFHGLEGNALSVGASTLRDSSITVKGKDNSIEIGSGCSIEGLRIEILGDGNQVRIGNSLRVRHVEIHVEDAGCRVELESDSTFWGAQQGLIRMVANEGTALRIGRDCLVGRSVNLRTGDGHSIVDLDGRRLNPSQDVSVGDHVWVGERVTVLKGAVVGDHCVVGADSVVTKALPESNCTLAGSPAVVLKRGTDWLGERI
jgi:acetyltransferase-like isoleucine patch superfamily enzyme